MFLSFGDERPFYEELEIQSPIFATYVRSVLMAGSRESPDLKSVYNAQNIVVYGNVPSGKTTQIYGYLATLFNTRSVYSIKNNVYSGTFQYKSSPFHIEFSTKFIKNTDITNDNKNIEFIRHITQTPNMLFQIPKVLYIKHFDMCSLEIQKFFLRIIEKSAAHTRFILEVRDLSKLNDAIISRFHILRMGTPRLVDQVIPILRKIYRTHRDGCEISEEELYHIVQYSHSDNFTTFLAPHRGVEGSREKRSEESTGLGGTGSPIPIGDLQYNLKAVFGNLAIYLSSFHNPGAGAKRLYLPVYLQRFVTLKEMIFQVTPKNFFVTMRKIREILLEIYVNNVSSVLLQSFLYKTFMHWIAQKWSDRGRGWEIQYKFTQVTSKMNYMLITSNKDVLFHELFILEMMKIILFADQEEEAAVAKVPEAALSPPQVIPATVPIEKPVETTKVSKRGRPKKVGV